MEITAKFCPCNFEYELDDVKDQLEEMGIIVLEDRCLNYCGQCLIQPYALVNGQNITGNSPEELLKNILQSIDSINQTDKQ
ncbi:DUF1450 domain-containing protein [Bacillus aerolatus]|uniref:DUF1450 domain-containing protein n=1 Tax=Bacillus aerolatus TaxID=2653354 RepID=A0A6I1FN15_9BACI|nr:DUF1450 domain-containing protein [Bacillus aerolatus]KAB7707844.1 DUF1450 domain-containing protein [Bacillus aerolatus]